MSRLSTPTSRSAVWTVLSGTDVILKNVILCRTHFIPNLLHFNFKGYSPCNTQSVWYKRAIKNKRNATKVKFPSKYPNIFIFDSKIRFPASVFPQNLIKIFIMEVLANLFSSLLAAYFNNVRGTFSCPVFCQVSQPKCLTLTEN